MSQMTPRAIPTAAMTARQSNDATRSHYSYDQTEVDFDQHFVTYEYSSYRGEMQPRIIGTVQMKGR